MFDFLDYRSQRIANILKTLVVDYESLPVLEIAKMNACSNKTVYNDIEYINNRWPSFFIVKKYDDRFYFAKKSIGNLQVALKDLFSEALSTTILCLVLETPFQNIDFYAEKSFSSISNVERAISQVNKELNPIDAKIISRKGKYFIYTKNELLFRTLISQMLFQYNLALELFEQDNIEEALNLLEILIIPTYGKYTAEHFRYLQALILLVSLHREKDGFSLDIQNKDLESFIPRKSIETLEFETDIFHLSTHEAILKSLFVTIYLFGYKNENKKIEQNVLEIVRHFYSTNLSNLKEKDILIIHKNIMLYVNYSKNYPIEDKLFFNRPYIYGKQFMERNYHIHELASLYNDKYEIWGRDDFDYHLYSLAFWVSISSPQINLNQKIKILVISDYSIQHAHTLVDYLKKFYPELEFDATCGIYGLDKKIIQQINQKKYNYIISTYNFDEIHALPYVLINDFPNADDLRNIYKLFEKAKP